MVSLDPGIKFCSYRPLGLCIHRPDLSPSSGTIFFFFLCGVCIDLSRKLALETDPEAGLAIRPC